MNHPLERIFTMNEEIPTVLMADDSVLDGRFTVWLEQRRVKRFHVSGWKTAWDSFHWTSMSTPSITSRHR